MHKASSERYRSLVRGVDISRTRGLSLIELLVVIAIIGVLFAIVTPVVVKVRRSAQTSQCISNLRQIGGALQSYAVDNRGRLPDPGIVEKSWEQMLDLGTPRIFQCPADHELSPALGSSYDWRDTGRNSTTMAGRLLADVRRTDFVLVFEALPGWHEKSMINVARVDGSVQTIAAQNCFKDLDTPVRDAKDAPVLAR